MTGGAAGAFDVPTGRVGVRPRAAVPAGRADATSGEVASGRGQEG
ncbi:hypothetical protein [Micromonospora sp. WMMD998]|nr:hypothetical protein [Micromonospora sp. WMMD998]WFE40195.1 hypothetical protein O7619_17810 [Micromonospora sp. WMMD998]